MKNIITTFGVLSGLLYSNCGVAAVDSATIFKAFCSFSGYSFENNKPQKTNAVSLGSGSKIINSKYDFSWNFDSFPDTWKGPKGRLVLNGSASSPEHGWAGFQLLFTDKADKGDFPPADSTYLKLTNNMEFVISKQVNKTAAAGETPWYIESRCRVTN